ncbi:MAG: LruC domain-containing protein [Candidatus Stygibacter australis]|nr:LruC domain-containing protein [Candidatus Stygibacter australis]
MKRFLFLLMVICIIISACSLTDSDIDISNSYDIPDDFDFATDQKVDFEVSLRNQDGVPISHIRYEIYYVNNQNQHLRIMNVKTDRYGKITKIVTIPSYVRKLYLCGLMDNFELPIVNGEAKYMLGPGHCYGINKNFQGPAPSRSFSYLDGIDYNSQGLPEQIELTAIDPELTARISTSLPEQQDLNDTHPQYIADGVEHNLLLDGYSDIWLTFVSEGTEDCSALGFYTYNQADGPPANPASLDHVLVFPNCSYPGSGGALESGAKIHLGSFEPGTAIGWFIVKDGWQSNAIVSETEQRFYSNAQYNPENASYNQHQILLYDDDYQLFVIGFEDQMRPYCDNDFNDLIFFAEIEPIDHVILSDVQPIDLPADSDGDGVSDPNDDYPNDPMRVSTHYYPVSVDSCTLVFEDLWPNLGDYDFNDIVIYYRYEVILDANDHFTDWYAYFNLKAAGAGFDNGFVIEVPFFTHDNTISITESSDNIEPIYEPEMTKALIHVFPSVNALTGYGGSYNTVPENPRRNDVTFWFHLQNTNPDLNTFAESYQEFPYNPFIIQNGDVSHEIHLMNFRHSEFGDFSGMGEWYFTGDDASDPGGTMGDPTYFVSSTGMPWGLNIHAPWVWPAERNSISDTYTHFVEWAESGNTVQQDWYLFEAGNVNMELVYNP